MQCLMNWQNLVLALSFVNIGSFNFYLHSKLVVVLQILVHVKVQGCNLNKGKKKDQGLIKSKGTQF